MISYCVVCFRAKYGIMQLEDLIAKTTVPYEILLWVNTADPSIVEFARSKIAQGAPIHILGITPQNIGMRAFKTLFQNAHYPMIVQTDDDVLCVSRRIAEKAWDIFQRRVEVRQIVADTFQDDWTNGARAGMGNYKLESAADGLYEGPIDGWFSIYHREALPALMAAPYSQYFYLGIWMRARLRAVHNMKGLLCTKFKVFHASGPYYAAAFGMTDFECRKYQAVGRHEVAKTYAGIPKPPAGELDRRLAGIRAHLDKF